MTDKKNDGISQTLLSGLIRIFEIPSFIRRIEWRSMLNHASLRAGEWILDVGCGGGELSLRIARYCSYVCGVEICRSSALRAKHLLRRSGSYSEIVVGDAQNLPLRDGFFDKILCSSSLEHFERDIDALEEMTRVLKRDGIAVLTVDSFTYPIGDQLKEMHRLRANVCNYYTRETLTDKFRNVGLETSHTDYLLNSSMTSLFFNFGIRRRWSGKVWYVFSLVAYPLSLVSDKLFGDRNVGYTLLAKAKKSDQSQD